MASLKALCLAGVASLGVTATVHAADLLPPPPPPPIYTPPPAAGFSGFYLRGDVGEGNLQLRDGYSTFSPNPNNYTTPVTSSSPFFDDFGNQYPAGYGTQGGQAIPQPYGFNQHYSVSPQVILGGGIGYQFNSFFRADVTGEYRFGGHYRAVEGYAQNAYIKYASDGTQYIGQQAGGGDYYSGNISNGVVLVNGYVDVGTWYHITPYIGAGVGVAFNHFSGVTDYNVSSFGQAGGSSSGHTNTQLAYAAMVGFAYDLTPNLKLDFGYRYLNMGSISTGQIHCFGGYQTCGNDSGEVQHYHLDSHDIRLGLRYAFAEPLIAPPVLIRKY